MGTPEGLRGLLDLVTVEEARRHQTRLNEVGTDLNVAYTLLQRYADTVVVMDEERKRAEETIRSLVVGKGRLAAQLDALADLKVQELVDATARAEAAEAELAAVLAGRNNPDKPS